MPNSKSWNIHHGEVLHSANNFDVIDCEYCGFKHIIPIPSEDELREIYRHEYHVKDKPLMLEHQLEDREWLDSTNDARLTKLEELLGTRGSFLDVGCGNGFLLAKAAAKGWEATGIEPSTQAASYAQEQGLNVTCTTFDEQTVKGLAQYDVVHLGDVLEHIPDPLATIKLCHSAVKPGGLLAVGVPNDYTPIQKILHDDMGERPWWVAPPHHINYFDEGALSALLNKGGFSPVHAEVSFPMELFLLMGNNYLNDPTCGRQCHAMRKTLELNLTKSGNRNFLDKLYHCFAQAGMGRTVLLIAQKHAAQD